MTAAEKIYVEFLPESPNAKVWIGGEIENLPQYTRADLSHAAIAAKNAQILDLIEALRKRSNGEICGCGVDNPTDVCLSHYDVIEAVVRNRVQAAIAAAMMGAAEHLYQLMMDNSDEALQAQIDCLLADMTLDGNPNLAAYFRDKLIASIPSNATTTLGAALLGAYKEGWSDGAANCHHDRNETPDDGWLISDTYKSIPTDATAAAIRAMKGGA